MKLGIKNMLVPFLTIEFPKKITSLFSIEMTG